MLNHATFCDADAKTVVDLELDTRTGAGRGALIMPQVHRRLPASISLQAGIGARKAPAQALQPQLALWLIE